MLPVFLIAGLCLAAGAAGCAKSTAPTVKKARSSGHASDANQSGEGQAQGPEGTVTFVDASPKACMLHAEADGYFRCLSAADGQCFHFGATCEPPASCMFERKSKLHKTCKEAHEGRCVSFGSTCEPKDSCMFDATTNRYRSCESASKGGCASFGKSCDPAA